MAILPQSRRNAHKNNKVPFLLILHDTDRVIELGLRNDEGIRRSTWSIQEKSMNLLPSSASRNPRERYVLGTRLCPRSPLLGEGVCYTVRQNVSGVYGTYVEKTH